MAKQKSKGAGGKLARSEIIQARLSPKIKFAAEILARKDNRTVSSLIETLIDKESHARKITTYKVDLDMLKESTIGDLVENIWSPDEMMRFVCFALNVPDLLTDEEKKIWSLISDTPYFWQCAEVILVDENDNEIGREWDPIFLISSFIPEHLQKYWEPLKDGELTRKDLPSSDCAGRKFTYTKQEYIPRKMIFTGRLNHLTQLNNRRPDESISVAIDVLRSCYSEKNCTLLDKKHIDASLNFLIRRAEAQSDDN